MRVSSTRRPPRRDLAGGEVHRAGRRRTARRRRRRRPPPAYELRRSSARSRASSSSQRERLDEVVVGAGVEAVDPVADRVAGGEHQDRRRRCRPRAAAGPRSRPSMRGIRMSSTIRSGWYDVDALARASPAVDGELGVVALEGEAAAQRLAHGGLVVDDQDALRIAFGGAHRSSSLPRWLRRLGAVTGPLHGQPRTSPCTSVLPPARSVARSALTVLTGMAKPRPTLPRRRAPSRVGLGRVHRGVDADDLAVHVDQGAAGVARVERGVGLDRLVRRGGASRCRR